MRSSDRIALGVILVVAAVLLFWRLGAQYLWQDEANTAVLAVRLLKFGKPLAYDGVNLLSNDNFAAEDPSTIGIRTTSARAGVDYIVGRGDLKPDTAWIFQPWGQFVAAAASIKLFGQTTLAARLPFALASLGTVVLLFALVRRVCNNTQIALWAAALLAIQPEWVLHSRQSRYYALSGAFLLATLFVFERWQRGGRWGAAVFVATAWLWFQVDYGTVWPVLVVLFVRATLANPRAWWKVALAGLAFLAAVFPFVLYYQLAGRFSAQHGTWGFRFGLNLFYLDRFLVPAVILIGAALLLAWRWRRINRAERQLVLTSISIFLALAFWIPTVSPEPVMRYVVVAAPAASIVTAWFLVRGAGMLGSFGLWVGAAIVVVTPWLTGVFSSFAPNSELIGEGVAIRPELSAMVAQVFQPRKDPNRAVVEWLRQNAAPTDEILVNYEDLPLMYYLPNPIRGGVAAFRAEDDSAKPPRFLVFRRSVMFVHWPVFLREAGRYQWDEIAVDAPDVIWGNNPDPLGQIQDPDTMPPLRLARRR